RLRDARRHEDGRQRIFRRRRPAGGDPDLPRHARPRLRRRPRAPPGGGQANGASRGWSPLGVRRDRRPQARALTVSPTRIVATVSTSAPNGVPDQPSSHRAIENLIATYAELVDDGDFAGVGVLLADATFSGGSGSVSGADANREDAAGQRDHLRGRNTPDQAWVGLTDRRARLRRSCR